MFQFNENSSLKITKLNKVDIKEHRIKYYLHIKSKTKYSLQKAAK